MGKKAKKTLPTEDARPEPVELKTTKTTKKNTNGDGKAAKAAKKKAKVAAVVEDVVAAAAAVEAPLKAKKKKVAVATARRHRVPTKRSAQLSAPVIRRCAQRSGVLFFSSSIYEPIRQHTQALVDRVVTAGLYELKCGRRSILGPRDVKRGLELEGLRIYGINPEPRHPRRPAAAAATAPATSA